MSAERKRLPNKRRGIRVTIGSGASTVVLSTGEYEDGSLGEVFLDSPKEGSFSRAILNALAISISISLQHGVPLATIQHSYRGFRMEPDILAEIMRELERSYNKPEV